MKKIAILLLICLSFSFSTHKYYLSLTEINHNAKNNSIELIMNVFMDDIEKALNNQYQIDLQLDTKKELADNDAYFKKYLSEHLQLKTDESLRNFNYIGKEYQGDLVFFYLEYIEVPSFKKLEIKNTVLVAEFSEQQNLIKAQANGIHRSKLLNKKNDKALLNF